MSKREIMNIEFEALKREAEFWKDQFFKLCNILRQGKEIKDDTFEHIKNIQKILED